MDARYYDEWLTMRDGVRWPTEQCGYAWANVWADAPEQFAEPLGRRRKEDPAFDTGEFLSSTAD